ncbi:hypothetical protein BCR44DRAFT_1505739, partial [Catenaria anguillulae PL171]
MPSPPPPTAESLVRSLAPSTGESLAALRSPFRYARSINPDCTTPSSPFGHAPFKLCACSMASGLRPAEGISTGVFVLAERVQADVAKAATAAKSVSSLTDSIMPVEEMLERMGVDMCTLSSTDVELLLHGAKCAGVLAYDSKTKLVKLVGWRQSGDKIGHAAEMTALDQRLYTIKHTAAKVSQQADEIQGRIQGLLEQARAHVRASNKALATRCLAQKKALTA